MLPGSVWIVSHLHPKKRGSMEQQLVSLSRRLRAQGVPVVHVYAGPPARYPGDELAELGVDVRTLPFDSPALAARRLLGWLQKERPAAVHFNFVQAFSPLVAAARLSGARVAVQDHLSLSAASGRFAAMKDRLKAARGHALGFLCDLRIAVSHSVARDIRRIDRVPEDRIAVVENGIDLSRFTGVDGGPLRAELGLRGAKVLACVARLHEEKGIASAIRAAALVPGAHLLLVGEGDQAPWKELARECGAGERVRFLGMRDDVERVLAACDVVLVPSHYEEAFGLAVAEGLASSKPVVVSRSGAMPELVGEAGLVVPKRDPAALAAAIAELLADPARARAMGAAGRKRAEERFSLEAWTRGMMAAYARLAPGLFAARRAA